ncbi:hypothetical protein N665_2947s0001 [Sinapis alba]|nr:hypothetical protein N665_2947s0001 [Sinapis alba]
MCSGPEGQSRLCQRRCQPSLLSTNTEYYLTLKHYAFRSSFVSVVGSRRERKKSVFSDTHNPNPILHPSPLLVPLLIYWSQESPQACFSL